MLYDIDGTIGALIKQAPPNDGVLNAVGKLGVKADKAAFDRLSDGKDLSLTPVTLKDYQPVIDMLKFNDEQRKKS